MVSMKPDSWTATLIGDVVRSRATPDRSALHAALVTLLEEANETLTPVVPLRITVGDEYQGCFTHVGQALHAALWLRLHLAPVAEVRHGIGWGAVAVLADTPRVEDGPGWWAAREAIESVKREASRAGSRQRRTSFQRAAATGTGSATGDSTGSATGSATRSAIGDGTTGPDPDPVNAALMCQDQMVGSLSERSLRLLRGVLDGHSQLELAEAERISASAVSQRVRHDGLAVILAADELLRRVT